MQAVLDLIFIWQEAFILICMKWDILTYIVVIAVVMLEMFSTKIKERVK